MATIALEPRALGPAREVLDRSTRASATSVRPGMKDREGLWDDAAGLIRLLVGTIAIYAFLIALTLLARVPIVAMGLFLGAVGALFSGIV